jgi:predicted DNA-binding transcriptional regulator YafY
MRTATRFPLERIAAIDRAVRAGEYPNAGTIARRFEVSRRTVQRDIEFMRDRLGAPLAFDQRRQGFAYSDPSFRLPEVPMSEGELLALALAERVLRQYRGTPYAADLARAFRKVTDGLSDRVTVDLGLLAESYSFRSTAPEAFDPDVFQGLAVAVRDRRRVVLRYWTASRDEETRRAVDPYHLACVDGHWYLIGHCHARGEVRMFNPTRIRTLEVTEAGFVPPTDFRIDEYLGRSFGVLRGGDGEGHRVRLRFTGEAAKYVPERTWHPSQALEPAADGGVVIGFELGHLREVERWALSWGPDCEVLEPAELRDRVLNALTAAAGRYATDSEPGRSSGPRRRGRPGSRTDRSRR